MILEIYKIKPIDYSNKTCVRYKGGDSNSWCKFEIIHDNSGLECIPTTIEIKIIE